MDIRTMLERVEKEFRQLIEERGYRVTLPSQEEQEQCVAQFNDLFPTRETYTTLPWKTLEVTGYKQQDFDERFFSNDSLVGEMMENLWNYAAEAIRRVGELRIIGKIYHTPNDRLLTVFMKQTQTGYE